MVNINATRVLVLIAVLLLSSQSVAILPSGSGDGAPGRDAGKYSDWQHHCSLYLDSPLPGENFQVLLKLNPTVFDYKQSAADGSDLRFTDTVGNDLSFCIENWNAAGESDIWIKMVKPEDTRLEMYWGKTGAASLSNASATYSFYDDFNDGVYDDKWYVQGAVGLYKEENGTITLSGYYPCYPGLGMAILQTKTKFWGPFIAEWKTRKVQGVNSGIQFLDNSRDFFESVNGEDTWGLNSYNGFGNHAVTTGITDTEWSELRGVTSGNSWQVFRGWALDNWKRNDTLTLDSSVDNRVFAIQIFSHEMGRTISVWDWIKVRRYSPENPIIGASIAPVKPFAPLNLNAKPGSGEVRLEWDSPASEGGALITSYKVYRGISPQEQTYLATVNNGRMYIDDTVTDGQNYYYRVSAVNSVGEGRQSGLMGALPREILVYVKSTSWETSRDGYKFVNPGTVWALNGNCLGMTQTAVLYYDHYVRGVPVLPSYPRQQLPAANTHALEPSGPFDLNNVSLAMMLHQVYDPRQRQIGDWTKIDVKKEYDILNDSISKGEPMVIGIGPADPHAVVVFGLEVNSKQQVRLAIWDPNKPDIVFSGFFWGTNKSFDFHPGYSFNKNDGTSYEADWTKFFCFPAGMIQSDWFPSNILDCFHRWKSRPIWLYNLIISDVKAKIISNGRVDSIERSGDSQSFTQQIPGTAGISEGGIRAFAVPWGTPYVVNTDPSEPSFVYMAGMSGTSDSKQGYGCLINVSSTTAYDYTLERKDQSTFKLVSLNSSLTIDATFFHIDGSDKTYLFKATMIPLAANESAEFRILDWSLLNSTKKPSVQLLYYNANGTTSYDSYNLTNNQAGLSPKPVSQESSKRRFISGPGVAGVILVVIIVVSLTRRKRGGTSSE